MRRTGDVDRSGRAQGAAFLYEGPATAGSVD